MSDLRVVEIVNSLKKQMRQALDAEVKKILPIGLNPSHAILLHFIVMNENTSSQDIQSSLCLSKSSVSETLSVLSEQNFIEYVKSEEDGRNKIIRITDRGLDLDYRVGEVVRRFEKNLLVGISEEEMETFSSVLERIRWNIEEAKYGS